MDLRQALGMLSKSSPYAVSTTGTDIGDELESIKKYLYVETDIERSFRAKLQEISSDEIIFLCGSSGDGKSEILARYYNEFSGNVKFHLDATHSFEPDMTAVETLNDVFSSFYQSNKGLVVGVNIGMLGNFAREGADEHAQVKHAFNCFLEKNKIDGNYTFIDFESFPKFNISEGEASSDFFSKILLKVVENTERNPYTKYLTSEMSKGSDPLLVTNFKFLQDKGVQKTIIHLLLIARIRKDQFITARMLLDFIYCILTGPGFLFDNIFTGGDNELLEAVSYFDPSVIRNKKLDLFVIHRTLAIEDIELEAFINELSERFQIDDAEDNAYSMLRCLYLVRESDFKSTYASTYSRAFNDTSFSVYRHIWEKHKQFDGSHASREPLKKFYNNLVLTSINRYANRNAPYLSKDQFYISSHGGYDIAAEIELSVSYKKIAEDKSRDISGFKLNLTINDEPLEDVFMNANLLDMMMGVVAGLRPNKHDKNSVVLLDKLVNKVTEIANASSSLVLYNGEKRIKLRHSRDGEIRVSGL